MKRILYLSLLCFLVGIQTKVFAAGTVSGELKRWHKVIVDFTGPQASEDDASTFLNYRLDVTFTNGTTTLTVPGFFAADGNAGESGASSGNIWRVNFCPTKVGTWTYTATFRKGTNVAIANNPSSFGTDNSIHGQTGTFTVAETDKTGRDMKAKGRLRYIGDHHLQYEGSGEYLMKAGPDSPENLLAYFDIDNTGGNNGLMKNWQPHVADWNNGDPTWKSGKGKGLIGALNYLAEEKMNAISFLTMNSPIGDDKNVFPWIDKNKQTQYDCSKLDQWEIIFSHAQEIGLHLHFKTQETENELVLDNGALGTERKLYYRELIARFAHHNSLEWNICEEGGANFSNTNQTQEQRRQSIAFFADNDPYESNVVVHTAPGLNSQKQIYNDFLGNGSKLTGVSLQNHWDDVFETTHHWVEASENANRKWVVANDEQGNAQIGVPHDDYTGTPTKEDIRKHTLWGNLMAGGAGVNYYFGYGQPDGNKIDILFNSSDMRCQDFRTRDISWDYARHAIAFFDLYLPFWEMHNDDSKTSNNNSHCLLKDGQVYVVYLRNGGTTNVNLPSGTFKVDWYNPRTGGALVAGNQSLNGGGNKGIGSAPTSGDWVALVRNVNFTHSPQWGNGFSVPDPSKVASVTFDETLIVLDAVGDTKTINATVLPTSATNKDLLWTTSDASIATVNQSGVVTATGLGRVEITATSKDGSNRSAMAEIVIGGNDCDGYTYGENWVVFEADVTKSNLDLWKVRKPGDEKYMQGTRTYGPLGEDYIEFTGNNENGGTPKSPLVYTFTAPKTAKYRLSMRLLQNLEGAEWDKSNDVWIRLEGDFTSANAFSTDDMKHDHKFYGRGKDNWGAGVKMEGHVNGEKTLVAVDYNLKKGEEYTFTMSGRAERTCIDYIIFYESSINYKLGEEVDIASENPPLYWPKTDCGDVGEPDVCTEIKAVDFDKWTGITGFTNAATDTKAGKDILQIVTRDAKAAAQYTYTGADADVYFKINAMQEIDGEPTYKVRVNGTLVGEGTNDRIHGTGIEDYTIQTHNINTTPFALKNGDLIQVEFDNVTNGLVPEGDLTATARGRWYSLEICLKNDIEPVVNKVDFVSLAAEIAEGASVPLEVSYTASAQQEVVAILHSPTGTWLGNHKMTVQEGTGTLDMNINNMASPLVKGNDYKVTIQIRPVGGAAADAFDEKSRLINVVGNEPVTGIEALAATAEVDMGSSIQLSTSVLPTNATNKTINWSTADNTIATVNANGQVTGVAEGVVRITATTDDGGFTAFTDVTVNKVTKATFSPIHDAYIQGTTPFNTADLRVESGKRVTYLMFDLSTLSGTVTKAELILGVGTDAGSGNVDVKLGNTNDWTETNITTSNAPTAGATIGSLNTTYALGSSYTWALSGVTSGGKISFVVEQEAGNDVSFSSKEGTIIPQLVITFEEDAPVDCHGDVNGTASLDACGVCSGGNTGVDPSTPTTWYEDADQDGLGDPAVTTESCTQPAGYVAAAGDECPTDANNLCNVITHNIPGTIEAEEFAMQEGIEAQPTQDVGGGENIGYIENGDKVTYQIAVTKAATYDVDVRVASNVTGGDIVISNGTTELGTISVSNTGGWQTWSTVSGQVALETTDTELTLTFTGGTGYLFNVNKMTFTEAVVVTDCNGDVNGTATLDACGVCSGGNTGVDPSTPTTWYEDADQDGLGDPAVTTESCTQPTGYVAVAGDECPTDATNTCNEPNDCNSPEFDVNTVYDVANTIVKYEGKLYANKWYTKGSTPGESTGPWKLVGYCEAPALNCGGVAAWDATTVYNVTGTTIVYNDEQYKNKHWSQNQLPGVEDVWEYLGPCMGVQAKLLAVTSIENAENVAVNVYPNPTVTEFSYVTIEGASEDINWELVDAKGNVVNQGVFTSFESEHRLDFNGHAGIFYLKLYNNTLNKIVKVSKL